MELNFDRLNNLITEKSTEESPLKTPSDGEKRLQHEANNTRDINERATEIYNEYQHNIKVSGQLQTEIIKGIQQGDSIYHLFLKAAKAISLMTSNTVFYSQIETDIKIIYGEGILEPLPLEMEINSAEERITRLKAAYERDGEPEDSCRRIMTAIQAHEAKINDLK